ncbi:MAG: peroxide stress protein YaaA, partial [SAR324 cluster bacterium]|nr:peroxide stress protein YaaA [SAR324 cluster bacterium]
MFAFNGDVYDGIDANTINTSNHEKLQNSLRILSGLY